MVLIRPFRSSFYVRTTQVGEFFYTRPGNDVHIANWKITRFFMEKCNILMVMFQVVIFSNWNELNYNLYRLSNCLILQKNYQPSSSTIIAIFCRDMPLHRLYIGLIYGRYLQSIGSCCVAIETRSLSLDRFYHGHVWLPEVKPAYSYRFSMIFPFFNRFPTGFTDFLWRSTTARLLGQWNSWGSRHRRSPRWEMLGVLIDR